jgi:hypothetical protein
MRMRELGRIDGIGSSIGQYLGRSGERAVLVNLHHTNTIRVVVLGWVRAYAPTMRARLKI